MPRYSKLLLRNVSHWVSVISCFFRLIIGWPEAPFKGSATISLHGSHDMLDFDYASADISSGPKLGANAIGLIKA